METNSEVLLLGNYNKGNFGGAGPLKRRILKSHARRSFEDLFLEREEKLCRRVLAWRACMYSYRSTGWASTQQDTKPSAIRYEYLQSTQ
jgi:hypothetical protein